MSSLTNHRALGLVALLSMLVACGGQSTDPTQTTSPSSSTPDTTAPTASNRQFGYVTAHDQGSGTVTFDRADFLTGAEATQAARAAGAIGPTEQVPNDYFIVNEDIATVDLGIDPDAKVILQACFVDGPCVTETEVTVVQWFRLMAGEEAGLPASFQWYGLGALPYWLTVAGDTVVEVDEVYLP